MTEEQQKTAALAQVMRSILADPEMAREAKEVQRQQLQRVRPLLGCWRNYLAGPYLQGIGGPSWRAGDLLILATVQPAVDESEWYHVSYSRQDRIPTHEDTLLVRRTMFKPDALAIAVYPPVDEYVNAHPYTLHLWQRLAPAGRLVPDLRMHDPLLGRASI